MSATSAEGCCGLEIEGGDPENEAGSQLPQVQRRSETTAAVVGALAVSDLPRPRLMGSACAGLRWETGMIAGVIWAVRRDWGESQPTKASGPIRMIERRNLIMALSISAAS
ncbi:MAG: hypothetical protein CMJ39_08065 [Phycisphaerae bacterium]|nr:hypothetical protein [Phycisphaerae bacterium]|tara:strand:+ start:154 stop:486 length:333 start_codon:yes stop_codon:yes gene_type:complete